MWFGGPASWETLMQQALIDMFAQAICGRVIGRDHPEYEAARKLYNAMIAKKPLSSRAALTPPT